MSIEELREKLEEWKLTLDDHPDYWDGVYASDRDFFGSHVKGFLDWLEEQKA